MVFDVELVVLPSRNVGGKFIGKVPIAGLLSKLDAVALPRKGSGKDPNGVRFRGKLHKNG
jgi:hypothetical protein